MAGEKRSCDNQGDVSGEKKRKVDQYNVSDNFSDGPVEEKPETLPCQGNSLYTFMRVEDESLAKKAMKEIASPLPADELEENPLDESEDEVEEVGAMQDGVAYSSVVSSIKQDAAGAPSRIQEAAKEMQNMDLLFDKIEEKMKGTKEFMTFLALFSLQGRQSDNKGDWSFNLNGKKVEMNKAEFSVEFHEKYDQKYYVNVYDRSQDLATNNVHIFGNSLFNDNFRVLVTPALRTKLFRQGDSDLDVNTGTTTHEPDEEVKMGNNNDEYHTQTIDQLAELVVKRIYETVDFNNKVDWWTDKTLTALEIAFTVASLCSGVGVLLKAGQLAAKGIHAAMIVVDASCLIDGTTRFLGINEKGYNPLLAGAKYLDKNSNTKSFETTFHALNLMMVFGAKSKTQVLTALGTASAGASIYVALDEEKAQTKQDAITTLEDDSNYNKD